MFINALVQVLVYSHIGLIPKKVHWSVLLARLVCKKKLDCIVEKMIHIYTNIESLCFDFTVVQCSIR